MKLWKRAAGAIKDQKCILAANLSSKNSFRNPYVEAAIIKATSHNERHVDYKNAQRVFCWIRTSPVSLKPLLWCLTNRMERTQSWVVALKGLMLMHGVFCCNTTAVKRIGKLPFDLSKFKDGHSKSNNTWGYNAFVRSYFVFLDQRLFLLYSHRKQKEEPMMQELRRLQNLQSLLDMLLQIRPLGANMRKALILEAMDCLIVEIFDIYSRICNGIASVLLGIYSAGKLEAAMALRLLKKATSQAEDLAQYFELCREFGAINAKEVPKITQISESDIHELERIINGVSGQKDTEDAIENPGQTTELTTQEPIMVEEQESKARLKTIITDKWEVFEDQALEVNPADRNPFLSHQNYLPIVLVNPAVHHKQDLPDLITF